jgi:hypothetical protein
VAAKEKPEIARFRVTFEVELTVEDTERLLATANELHNQYESAATRSGLEIIDDIPEVADAQIHDELEEALFEVFGELGLSPLFEGAGLRVDSTTTGVDRQTVSEQQYDLLADFDPSALFPLETGEEHDDDAEVVITPRTAFLLHAAAAHLSDEAYDDTDPANQDDSGLFGTYPRITHREGQRWRRQAARCYDDLAHDLEIGAWPRPTCVGEEIALWKIVGEAEDPWMEEVFAEFIDRLPLHPADRDFDLLREVLFEDLDFQMLYDPSRDGIEDPDDPENRFLGIGDNLKPENWFQTFLDMPPRDPMRGFRR